jgi:TfoX/Sxy family transcriptional regulator of competence genes
MSTDSSFIEFIREQLAGLNSISHRKMFGEYALYCEGKVVALVCDNQLFIKPTEKGKAFVGDISQAPPYPGAKLYFLVEEKLEDQEWLKELIQITADELPLPKPKKPKAKRTLKNSAPKPTPNIRSRH